MSYQLTRKILITLSLLSGTGAVMAAPTAKQQSDETTHPLLWVAGLSAAALLTGSAAANISLYQAYKAQQEREKE